MHVILSQTDLLICLRELVLAIILGGIIGWDREIHGRPAGLRTHILVCTGACLISLVDCLLVVGAQGKIAGQIVTGVGFLGAGTILRSDKGSSVHGLTTAASLWATAGVGIALGYATSGTDTPLLAVAAALFILITLTIVSRLERVAIHWRPQQMLTAVVNADSDENAEIAVCLLVEKISSMGAKINGVDSEGIAGSGRTQVLHLQIHMAPGMRSTEIIHQLNGLPNISQVDWEV